MNAAYLIESLERFPTILSTVLAKVSADDAHWKPSAKDWSIVEIIAHLADEERDDFPKRLRLILEDPTQDWPPIDPEGWAREREYNARTLEEVEHDFFHERQRSIAWLKKLAEPDWTTAKHHPKFGSMTAGELMASWAAHDLLHLRQITKRLYQLVEAKSKPYSPEYAGGWST